MKVVSLMQPWATLIALGEKSIETRSWATKYRGEIAIHASKTIDRKRCEQPTFKRLLKKTWYNRYFSNTNGCNTCSSQFSRCKKDRGFKKVYK